MGLFGRSTRVDLHRVAIVSNIDGTTDDRETYGIYINGVSLNEATLLVTRNAKGKIKFMTFTNAKEGLYGSRVYKSFPQVVKHIKMDIVPKLEKNDIDKEYFKL